MEVIHKEDTFWLTQKRMAELFGVEKIADKAGYTDTAGNSDIAAEKS